MPPGRAKAWVDSLPEYDIAGSGYAATVLVTSEYPYCFAIVYNDTHYVEVKQAEGGQQMWSLSEDGVVVEVPRPSANDLKQALNLPDIWNLGFVTGKPNTWSYRFKLLPQE